MSRFENLSYLTKVGTLFPCRTSNPRLPFAMPWQGPSVLPKVRWEFQGKPVELDLTSYAQMVVDPGSDLLVVVTASDDFAKPGNAAVFQPDGRLDHQLVPPATVELSLGHAASQTYPVEGIEAVRIQEGKLRVDLNFRYEWIEERYYDPVRQVWGDCINVSRK